MSMIKCPSCGANLKWNPSLQKLKCDFCRTEYDAENLKREAKKAKEDKNYITEAKCYKCTSCGAELLSYDETAVTFCSYCGNQSMIESKLIEKNNPEYIIPFKKSQEECIKEYKKTISKSLFVPNYMKEDLVIQKFRGIYMPYAIYHFSHDGNCDNKGKKYNHRSGDYVYYDIYSIKSDVSADYNGISYDLLSIYDDRFSQSIPFDFNEAIPYNTNYIAGFYADTLDVDADTYTSEANKTINEAAKKELKKEKQFLKYGCSNPEINLSLKEKKIGMFPVYFLGVQDKSSKYISYAVINGETGKVAMDLPIDFKKYILGCLILTIPIFLLINSFLVLTPTTVLIIGLVISLISMIISNSQLNELYERKIIPNNEKKSKKNKMSLSKKIFKYLYKQILSIILGIAIIGINFVDDLYYYGGAVIVFLFIIWSFYDLVKEHNQLSKNKLPQLEKRGGDEIE